MHQVDRNLSSPFTILPHYSSCRKPYPYTQDMAELRVSNCKYKRTKYSKKCKRSSPTNVLKIWSLDYLISKVQKLVSTSNMMYDYLGWRWGQMAPYQRNQKKKRQLQTAVSINNSFPEWKYPRSGQTVFSF